MKKTRTWAGLLVLVAVFLAGCAEKDIPPKPEDGVLIYAALNKLSPWLEYNIEMYNGVHPDTQIEVRDYSDESGPQRLMTELMLGSVPDIIEMQRMGYRKSTMRIPDIASPFDPEYTEPMWRFTPFDADTSEQFYMPYRALVQRGYLEDLWPYIEEDFGRERIMEAPLKAAEVDGGLYMIPKSVSINTLGGPVSMVGDRCGWTLKDLLEAFDTMPEDSTALRYGTTRGEVFFNLLAPQLEQFIDWKTGECSFDSQGFRDMLEFLSFFPLQFHTWLTKEQLFDEKYFRQLDGMQLLEPVLVTTPRDALILDEKFQQDTSFVGWPTADGSSGSSFIFHGPILAMSSACDNKDAAWDFMCRLLRADSKSISWAIESIKYHWISIPLNRIAYNLYIKASMFPLSPQFIPGEKHRQRFEELFESTTQLYWPDDTMADAVWDAIGPYFAGDRNLDDTIALIQDRVTLYINEQK